MCASIRMLSPTTSCACGSSGRRSMRRQVAAPIINTPEERHPASHNTGPAGCGFCSSMLETDSACNAYFSHRPLASFAPTANQRHTRTPDRLAAHSDLAKPLVLAAPRTNGPACCKPGTLLGSQETQQRSLFLQFHNFRGLIRDVFTPSHAASCPNNLAALSSARLPARLSRYDSASEISALMFVSLASSMSS